MSRTLAIIGGMGASAGVRLAQHLVHRAQIAGAKSDSDFPDFMLYNLPLEGMDETGIINGAPVKRKLHEAFNRINDWGCDYVLVACNTVHCFYSDMQSWCNGRVLNMIDIACDRALTGKVGVVSSETTRKIGLYQDALKHRKIEPVMVNPDEQRVLNAAIQAVIIGDIHVSHRLQVQDVLGNLRDQGAGDIIIGCTELPLVCDPIQTIDAGAAAVDQAFELISAHG